MIYMERIANIAEFYEGINSDYSEDRFRKGSVLHELGHGRVALEHLCIWDGDGQTRTVNTSDHDHPRWSGTCIMAGTLPYQDCVRWMQGPDEEDEAYPLDFAPFYCSKCLNKLKNVRWE